jgi:hypothetical protein
MVWCPMITAQYVIVRHVTGRPVVNGVFFGSAMLDYRLYQSYFPTWALSRHAASMRDEGVSGARP